MASQRTLTRQRGARKLPNVPAVVFPDGLKHLEALANSMLQSNEFKDAFNEAALSMRAKFFGDLIPEQVAVHANKALDKQKMFGLTDADSTKIQMSANLCEHIRKYPHNNSMNLFACTVAIHEISHVLIRTAMKFEKTPEKFNTDYGVSEFGFFIERRMFTELELGKYGLSFVVSGKRRRWVCVNGKYKDAELGCVEAGILLTKEYVDDLVNSNNWRKPNANDIMRNANFVNKIAIGRRSLVLPIADYESHCGVSRGITLASIQNEIDDDEDETDDTQ